MNILRYGIPNSFTAASLLLGLGSIVTGILGDLELAGWMIVWCGLLDVMDGLTARLLKKPIPSNKVRVRMARTA